MPGAGGQPLTRTGKTYERAARNGSRHGTIYFADSSPLEFRTFDGRMGIGDCRRARLSHGDLLSRENAPEPVFTYRSSSTWCEQGSDVVALASKSHHQAFVFSARPLPFGADLWMGSEG
jgi:hypothetical protein